jgi:hypothetical protein
LRELQRVAAIDQAVAEDVNAGVWPFHRSSPAASSSRH